MAHAFPVIILSVYTKPDGQRAYKGHCIHFSQDIQQLVDTLARYPRELLDIVITVKNGDNTSKDLTVCCEKVLLALHWLVEYNSVYKDITIDYNYLASLPPEGI